MMPDIVIADIVIAAVLVLAVIVGACRGLVKSLAGVVTVVGALIGASFASQAFAEPVARWIGPLLQDSIQQKLLQQDTASAESMLSAFNFDGTELQKMLEEVMQTVSDTGAQLLQAVSESVTLSLAYALVYLVAFLVLLLVLWLALKPVCLLVKLPVLRTLDRLGGGALGLIWGGLLVFLAVWLMLRFDVYLTADMVDASTLLRFFAHNSPLSLLASL